MIEEYRIYVPALDSSHDIRARSAIVGERQEDHIFTHYEGGGASNVQTFEEKLNIAAGRRLQRAPTVAQRAWRCDELVEVATARFDETMRHWVISEIIDEESLRAWVGPDEPLTPGGSDKLIEECGGRAFSKLTMAEQSRILGMRLPMTALCAEVLATIRRSMHTTATGL